MFLLIGKNASRQHLKKMRLWGGQAEQGWVGGGVLKDVGERAHLEIVL